MTGFEVAILGVTTAYFVWLGWVMFASNRRYQAELAESLAKLSESQRESM